MFILHLGTNTSIFNASLVFMPLTLNCPSTLLFCDVLAAHTHSHTQTHTQKQAKSLAAAQQPCQPSEAHTLATHNKHYTCMQQTLQKRRKH